jgi:hypothetical protein
MSVVDANINLCGEYRIKVLEKDTIVSDSGWCKNTILSGGLIRLATLPFSDILYFLDLGTSSALSATPNYSLSGVISPSSNSTLLNVERDNFQIIYNSTYPNLRTYYTSFTTQLADIVTETIKEFAIKPYSGSSVEAFSRAVLPTPTTVNFNQAVNFEYRLSVDWSSYVERDYTPFRMMPYTIGSPASSYNTFYVPTTSTIYNIPEDRLFNPLTKLILCKNNEELPAFGDAYPSPVQYGLESEASSTFNSNTLSAYLDKSKKCFNIITQYSNISAPQGAGVLSGISTAILVSPDTNTKFLATRFKHPITLYNYERLSDVIGLSTYNANYDIFRKNLLGLNYRYAWGESLYATIDAYDTYSAAFPLVINANPDIPCNVYKTVQCGNAQTVRILGSPVTYKIRVIVGAITGNMTLNYNCNNVATRFLGVYYPNDNTSLSAVPIVDSGYRGTDQVFTPELNSVGYPSISGPATGTVSFTKSLSTHTFIDIITYSPLSYAGVNTYVQFNVTCPT